MWNGDAKTYSCAHRPFASFDCKRNCFFGFEQNFPDGYQIIYQFVYDPIRRRTVQFGNNLFVFESQVHFTLELGLSVHEQINFIG